jgi:hypothetical protein
MLMNEYAVEKLRELNEESLGRTVLIQRAKAAQGAGIRRNKPVVGPVMRVAGRTLRRAGEGLESWASPPQPECEGGRWSGRTGWQNG